MTSASEIPRPASTASRAAAIPASSSAVKLASSSGSTRYRPGGRRRSCSGVCRPSHSMIVGAMVCSSMIRNSAEGRFEATQRGGRGHGTGLPAASPNSAPRRVCSHATSRASISRSDSSGCSRRSFSRIMSSPVRNRSNASWSRRAAAWRSALIAPFYPIAGRPRPGGDPLSREGPLPCAQRAKKNCSARALPGLRSGQSFPRVVGTFRKRVLATTTPWTMGVRPIVPIS